MPASSPAERRRPAVESTLREATEAYRWSRLSVAIAFPYVATAVYALQLHLTSAVPTAAVDRAWRIYVNPEMLCSWTHQERTAVVYHELNHLLRAHSMRAEDLDDALLFGVCADLEINDDIDEERTGLRLPDGALHPGLYGLRSGLLAEEYYRNLATSGGGVSGRGGGDAAGGGGPPLASQTSTCGSGADGVSAPWEIQDSSSGVSPVQAEALVRGVAEQIAKSPGNVPGGLWHVVRRDDTRPLDWRRLLQRYLVHALRFSAGGVDHTYTRLSRRAEANPDVVLPALRQPNPVLAIVVDTSASMGPDELAASLTEVAGLVTAVGAGSLSLLLCDAEVSSIQHSFRPTDDVDLMGGGGTNMGAGIAAAASLRPPPDAIVVITDAFTPWPTSPPRPPVIVCRLDPKSPPPPDWTMVVDRPARSGPR